ncbi:MAG: putative transposase [Mycobacterium sp.]|nr:putative transposase [Mycobacterium sp.]
MIGWAIDDHMRADLVESALSMAVAMRGELAEAVILPPTAAVSTPPRSWRGSPTGITWPVRSAALVCAGITLRPNHSGRH